MNIILKTLLNLLPVFCLVIITHSCKKVVIPTLTDTDIINITATTASGGGTISDDGSGTISERGICWGKNSSPTIADNRTIEIGGIGTFTSNMSGLNSGTKYYARAYATNSAGTGYGTTISFITILADIDGNVYAYLTIGNQVWMKGNLKTSKYRNGDLIGTSVPSTKEMITEANPKYQWPSYNFESNVATYGRLYTWYAVNDSRNVCPAGWHVPSDAEWTTLTNYLGGLDVAGGKLKEAGLLHWATPNTGATNESGFTALPGGYRLIDGSFYSYEGRYDIWWSSTEVSASKAPHWGVGYIYSYIYRVEEDKRQGISVRCLRD